MTAKLAVARPRALQGGCEKRRRVADLLSVALFILFCRKKIPNMPKLYLILETEVPGALPDVNHHTFDEAERDAKFQRLVIDLLGMGDGVSPDELDDAWDQHVGDTDGVVYSSHVVEICLSEAIWQAVKSLFSK